MALLIHNAGPSAGFIPGPKLSVTGGVHDAEPPQISDRHPAVAVYGIEPISVGPGKYWPSFRC